ncbi:hypothetical protein OSG_eHP18_00230 [environmental Halophage eHP-18]|nr:hypothetical protein OSG_eHP17_00140 [environmental Halophage eHP-17]AFH22203.1 hypothetical protein OSG_eHP18_00230 [environmental Halophage eHP-18]AFH22731.1 hypothetical protein OSG_eHP33_00140 [environmental Halophage eHP-33]
MATNSEMRVTTFDSFSKDEKKPEKYIVDSSNYGHGTFFRGSSGYYMFRGGDNCDYVPIHRLVAVAEYGVKATENKQIHHKNGVKWDNRPENLICMSNSEHQRHENKQPLAERLELSTDRHIANSLEDAGYSEAADSLRE